MLVVGGDFLLCDCRDKGPLKGSVRAGSYSLGPMAKQLSTQGFSDSKTKRKKAKEPNSWELKCVVGPLEGFTETRPCLDPV